MDEATRLRRRRTADPRSSRPRRPPRAVIAGELAQAVDAAAALAALGGAEVVVAVETPLEQRAASSMLGGAARVCLLMKDAAPCDALIVLWEEPSRVRDVALWAARTCPLTVLILTRGDTLELSRQAARASGLSPWLILSPGGMPRARAEVRRLAERLGASGSQVCVPVIGGGLEEQRRLLHRYATVAGIPAREISEKDWRRWIEDPPPAIAAGAATTCALALARAVLEDRLEVFSCGAWVGGDAGLPGGFVTMPVRVGARGAEEPLPLKLTLDERALLQRTAVAFAD